MQGGPFAFAAAFAFALLGAAPDVEVTPVAAVPVATSPVAAAEPVSRGLLFRLDKPGLPPSFVFGTLHSGDPRVTALPKPVAIALGGARTLVVGALHLPGERGLLALLRGRGYRVRVVY